MILGVGTDIVRVDRFERWKDFTPYYLRRVFSEQEILDCSDDGTFDRQSFAARFAAKEAVFKALSASLVKLGLTNYEFSFLFFCKYIQVTKPVWDVPQAIVDWNAIEARIGESLPPLQIDLSISHEQGYTIAFAVITR